MRVLALLLLAVAPAAAANPECLACHAGQHVKPELFAASVHGPLGCTGCHASVDLKKHPPASRKTGREYTLAAVEACKSCHQPIHEAYIASAHGKARESGAPVCSDCHKPHEVTRASVGTRLKETCLACHSGAVEAHDKWLPNTRRHLAVVACAACHAPAAKRKVDLRFYDAAGRNEVVGPQGELQPGKPLDEKALWALLRSAGAGGKVRLVGRVEVTSADQAHAMADRGQALKECTTCHRKGAEAFQTVTLSVVGPDGRRVYYDAQKEVLSSPFSVDSVRGFYVVGGTRMGALDLLLLVALAAGIAAPLGHLLLRRLLRRKDHGKDLH